MEEPTVGLRERGALVGLREREPMVGRPVVACEAGVPQKPVLPSPGFPVARTSSNQTISAGNRSRRDVAAATAAIPLILLPQPHRPVYEPSVSIYVPALSRREASDFSWRFHQLFDGVEDRGPTAAVDGMFITAFTICDGTVVPLGCGQQGLTVLLFQV